MSVGDVVELRTNGRAATVRSEDIQNDSITCQWYSRNQFETGSYSSASLILLVSNIPTVNLRNGDEVQLKSDSTSMKVKSIDTTNNIAICQWLSSGGTRGSKQGVCPIHSLEPLGGPIAVGRVVELISNHQAMTIIRINGDMATCEWDSTADLQEADFPIDCLKR